MNCAFEGMVDVQKKKKRVALIGCRVVFHEQIVLTARA